jgi:hypothetical protein
MVAAVRHGGGLSDVRPLLNLAVKGDPAAAHGLGADVNSLIAIDPRLPKSLLRCAFTRNIRAHLKRHDGNADEDAARQRQVAEWREKASDAEWRWLQVEGDEPLWPKFPVEIVINDALGQFVANWPALTETHDRESIHQMRVALRRLRTALAFVNRLARAPGAQFSASHTYISISTSQRHCENQSNRCYRKGLNPPRLQPSALCP